MGLNGSGMVKGLMTQRTAVIRAVFVNVWVDIFAVFMEISLLNRMVRQG